jgi:hypothetical protein
VVRRAAHDQRRGDVRVFAPSFEVAKIGFGSETTVSCQLSAIGCQLELSRRELKADG